LDGKTFRDATFPSMVNVQANGFSVIQSSREVNEGFFIDSSQNDDARQEYGSLFVSDLEGIQFTNSLTYTNRDERGNVEVERVDGISGIILANQVANPTELGIGGSLEKKIQTVLSVNNGATWAPIKAPKLDSNGKEFCNSDHDDSCRLHLHLLSSSKHSDQNAAGVVVAIGTKFNPNRRRKCRKIPYTRI
jgi:hypothetical protein